MDHLPLAWSTWRTLGICEHWWHSIHICNNEIVANLVLIHALWIVHFTLKSIWREHLYYAKSTSNQPCVKPRYLIMNPIFNQPKYQFWDLLEQIVHSHTCTKQSWKYICKRPRTMVLSALYLASTTSLITILGVEPSPLQRKHSRLRAKGPPLVGEEVCKRVGK